MEVRNEYGKSRVVVVNVGQDDVDGMLINWDLTDEGKYDYMEKEFTDRYGAKVELITDIGPVIGAHAGPGTMAIFFLGKER